MGGSIGGSKGSNQNESEFSEGVWGGQGDALQGFLGQLGGLFNQGAKGMGGRVPGAADNMQGVFDQSNPHWQDQMAGGAYKDMDLAGMYENALGGGGNEQFMNEQIMGGAGNNYVDAMRGQMEQTSSDNLGRNLAANDARAAGYGQSGSSRHGITERGINDASSKDLMNAQTKLGYDTFAQDQDRKMNIARNADAFDMGKIQNIGGALGNKQNTMAGGMGMGKGMQGLGMGQFAPYMAPWQMAGQFGDILGDPTKLGSGSSSGSGKNLGMGFSGGK